MPIEGKAEFIQRLKDSADQLCRALALETHGRVVRRTPVDTGRARANWNVAESAPDASAKDDATRADVQAKLDEGARVIGSFRAGGVLYITNALSYIPALEDGKSKQAPQGMVKVTVAELKPLAGRIAAKVASGQ